MTIGIYKITNSITQDYYIGSSVNIEKRWRRHLTDLKQQIHPNTRLQRSYNKYGKDAFLFDILHICEKDILIVNEQLYIDSLKPIYNLCPKAGGMSGYKQTAEHIEKRTKKLIGKKISEEEKLRLRNMALGRKPSKETIEKRRLKVMIKIRQYSMSGEFIKEWASSMEANKIFGGTSICRAVNGVKPSAHGFIWIKEHNQEEIQKRIERINTAYPNNKFIQMNKEGNILNIFNNMGEVENHLKIKNANKNIHSVCNGKRKTAYEYMWKKA